MSQFDPENWAISTMRALKQYALTGFPATVWEMDMSYPAAVELGKRLPLKKPLIHFEMENVETIPYGLGDSWVNAIYDEDEGTVEYWEAHRHEVVWDIGIWTSAESGGTTSRMQARDILDRFFVGPRAREECMTNTNGVEILSFSGGRNVVDTINDLTVYRMVDIVLSTRVFSRRKLPTQVFIEEHATAPELEIDGIVIVG